MVSLYFGKHPDIPSLPDVLAVLILVSVISLGSVEGQGPRQIDQFGTPWWDSANGVFVDVSGVYVSGETAGVFEGQVSSGGFDAFLRKYDLSGREVWTRQFGTSQDDVGHAVSLDSTGVYIAGITYGAFPNYENIGLNDAFLAKTDFDGNELWVRQFGTTQGEFLGGISADGTGVYVVGAVAEALPGQTDLGGPGDAFVRKYDSQGNELWTRQFGGPGPDSATGVSVDSTGVYVAGFTWGALPGHDNMGLNDVFLAKFDSQGNGLWTRQFGTVEYDFGNGVSAGMSGVYVVGETLGVMPGQSGVGGFDGFVQKFDSEGSLIWTRQLGSSYDDSARSISVSESGVYLTGITFGAFQGQTFFGQADVFAQKYDPLGREVWTRQFGSIDLDDGLSVSAGVSGVHVVGHTWASLPGQASHGSVDAFIAKLPGIGFIESGNAQ